MHGTHILNPMACRVGGFSDHQIWAHLFFSSHNWEETTPMGRPGNGRKFLEGNGVREIPFSAFITVVFRFDLHTQLTTQF